MMTSYSNVVLSEYSASFLPHPGPPPVRLASRWSPLQLRRLLRSDRDSTIPQGASPPPEALSSAGRTASSKQSQQIRRRSLSPDNPWEKFIPFLNTDPGSA